MASTFACPVWKNDTYTLEKCNITVNSAKSFRINSFCDSFYIVKPKRINNPIVITLEMTIYKTCGKSNSI